MTKAEAKAIVKNIHSNVDPEEKLTAIQDICDMKTHNDIAKSDLVECLRWIIEEYL